MMIAHNCRARKEWKESMKEFCRSENNSSYSTTLCKRYSYVSIYFPEVWAC